MFFAICTIGKGAICKKEQQPAMQQLLKLRLSTYNN